MGCTLVMTLSKILEFSSRLCCNQSVFLLQAIVQVINLSLLFFLSRFLVTILSKPKNLLTFKFGSNMFVLM